MPKYNQDKRNANRGTERGRELLKQSLSRLGPGRSILVDKHGTAIAGNKTLAEATSQGIPTVEVETDGKTLVVVKRTDLDLETDIKARELAFADNRVAELDLDWDTEVLKTDLEVLDTDFLNEMFKIDVIGDTTSNLPTADFTNWKAIQQQSLTKRVLIGEIEFGISEEQYNSFLELLEVKLKTINSQRLAAQEVFNDAFCSD